MKFLVKKAPILGSSQNPKELSTMIRGLIVLLLPTITRISGLDIPEDSVIEFFDQGVIFYGMVTVMFGTARKIYYQIKK